MRAVLVGLTLLWSLPASADDEPQARRHYERAVALVKLGDHVGAIRELELSYQFSHRPNRLFDIGEQYRILAEAGAVEKMRLSIDFFERYLREKPKAEDRKQVESTIAELRARVASAEAASREGEPRSDSAAAAAAALPPPAPPPAEVKRPTPTWVWVLTGVGAAVVVGGAVGLGVGLSQHDSPPDSGAGRVGGLP